MNKTPKRRLTKKALAALTAALILIIAASAFAAVFFSAQPPKEREFYYGVEVAYGGLNEIKAAVDETKSYTNLVIFGVPQFTQNLTALNLGCDYVYNSGLHFIVLLTNTSQYTHNGWENTTPAEWAVSAKEKYGEKFLAVYRWDEPGGDQIDHSKYQEVKNASDYADAAQQYVDVLGEHVEYYKSRGAPVVTADYVLHWFDYEVGYDAVLAEFGWNNSRQQQIALVRGAARAHDRDWGAIVTWEYSQEPYIENASALYNDLVMAYDNGAKYAAVFSYPELDGAKLGILSQGHLDAIRDFSDYVAHNPPKYADYRDVKTAYVLPADYGFGFRTPQDSIWGLWPANSTTWQIYSDVEGLIKQKGTSFDIVCECPNLLLDANGRYDRLIYWNGTQITPVAKVDTLACLSQP